MAKRALENINLIRNSTALGGFLRLTGGVNRVGTNYTTTANDYIVVATALSLTITIGTVSQNSGQWIIVKDGTGKASVESPLKIDAQGGIGFDNNSANELFITSPNGAIALFVDPTGNEIWSAPWNSALEGTLPTTFFVDRDINSPTGNFILVTLPLGISAPDTITVSMEGNFGIPFITADQAASTATMTFSHRFFDGTNQVLTVPNTANLTVTNPMRTYFTADGLQDNTQNYLTAHSFGELRIDVLGDAANSTPRQSVIINFDSRGFTGGVLQMNVIGTYRNAQFRV